MKSKHERKKEDKLLKEEKAIKKKIKKIDSELKNREKK